jgi:Protein phosphatase 2C
VRLASAITEGSGTVNEDGFGLLEKHGEVSAAWVFDGVTGINPVNILPAASDASWLVQRAHQHLVTLAALDISLSAILEMLVSELKRDWQEVAAPLAVPAHYDHPAACLLLVKKYAGKWQAMRLGDSLLLTKHDQVINHPHPPSDLGDLELKLRNEARRRRETGTYEFKALLAEFRPQLVANRKHRNKPGSYSILVADQSALAMPEFIDLGSPQQILLCTDGFYRAVDTYALHDDPSLMRSCARSGGADKVLHEIRMIEAQDPQCQTHLRFKPADDATAVMLIA